MLACRCGSRRQVRRLLPGAVWLLRPPPYRPLWPLDAAAPERAAACQVALVRHRFGHDRLLLHRRRSRCFEPDCGPGAVEQPANTGRLLGFSHPQKSISSFSSSASGFTGSSSSSGSTGGAAAISFCVGATAAAPLPDCTGSGAVAAVRLLRAAECAPARPGSSCRGCPPSSETRR